MVAECPYRFFIDSPYEETPMGGCTLRRHLACYHWARCDYWGEPFDPTECDRYQRARAEAAEAEVERLKGELAEAKKFLGYVRPKLVRNAWECDIWKHSEPPVTFTCMGCGELACDLRWEMWRIDQILGCADPKLTAAYRKGDTKSRDR